MPAMHFSSVLLPLPLRPTMPKNSPGRTAKEMSFSAYRSSWRERRSGCSARSLSVWLRSSGILKRLWTPSTANAGRPWTAVCSGGMVTGGYSEGARRSAGDRSGRSVRAAAERTAERPGSDEAAREDREQRPAHRRVRAEREQRPLKALGQRSARPDQAQAEADLRVELLIHALRVFALAHELRRLDPVLDAQSVFARDRVAAERGGVAHRQIGR